MRGVGGGEFILDFGCSSRESTLVQVEFSYFGLHSLAVTIDSKDAIRECHMRITEKLPFKTGILPRKNWLGWQLESRV